MGLRLKEGFDLPYSTRTINRVLKQNGLIKRKDLRGKKPFSKIQVEGA